MDISLQICPCPASQLTLKLDITQGFATEIWISLPHVVFCRNAVCEPAEESKLNKRLSCPSAQRIQPYAMKAYGGVDV
jgi:hypothetical protein